MLARRRTRLLTVFAFGWMGALVVGELVVAWMCEFEGREVRPGMDEREGAERSEEKRCIGMR